MPGLHKIRWSFFVNLSIAIFESAIELSGSILEDPFSIFSAAADAVSYTHLRAHET